jgi:uncharacterized protein with ParB-like and HNH nuclease domain
MNDLAVKPDVYFLTEILSNMNKGKYVLPKFQRPFVWKPESMISLMDSIYRSYPIGSLLFWVTSEEYAVSKIIGGHELAISNNSRFTYVLDGHQRLSTLYGTLIPNKGNIQRDENNWQWFIFFDLENEVFTHLKPSIKTIPENYFPMNKLLGTIDFLHEAKKISSNNSNLFTQIEAKKYIEKAEDLLNKFKYYKIAISQIEGGVLSDAIDIYARLNSEGEKMSTDSIYSALTYKDKEFDLSVVIDNILNELSTYNFNNISRNIIFNTIILNPNEKYKEIKNKKNLETYSKALAIDTENVNNAIKSIIDAAKFLNTLGVYSDKLLPYYVQFIALSEFFKFCPEPSESKKEILTKWFWATSFIIIENGNSSKKVALVQEMRDFALFNGDNVSDFIFTSIKLDEPASPLPSDFNVQAARVRAFLLFLLSLKPICILTKEPVNLPTNLLISEPASAFIQIVGAGYREINEKRNNIANRLFIVDWKDRNLILQTIKNKNIVVSNDILASQCISEEAYKALVNNDFDKFLELRTPYLRQQEIIFLKSKGITPPEYPS